MGSVELPMVVVEPVVGEPGSAVPVEVLMVVVEAVVHELGAAVQAVAPIVAEQPMVDELGAATGTAVTVLDTMEPTVAPTVAELAEVAETTRSIHCCGRGCRWRYRPRLGRADGVIVRCCARSWLNGPARSRMPRHNGAVRS